MDGSPAGARSASRREFALFAGIVALLVVAFLHEPWLRFSDHTFTAADSLTDYGILKPDPAPERVGNRLLGDTVIQMQPWIRFAVDEVHAGRWPTWSPYNGAGAPLLGNYQSAVFSPFQWAHYLFGFKFGVLFAATAKLLVAGLFTALFLRELGRSRLAALLGAVCFAFSGQLVVLLAYPHSGVSALLPAALYFAERACGAFERSAPRREFARALVGLVVALTAAAYAGHPEPFVFVLAVTVAWIVVRVARASRTLGGDLRAARRATTTLAAFLGAGLLAGALSAPQWMPFAEYLERAVSNMERPGVDVPGFDQQWPLQMFPSALGMPVPGREIDLGLPPPNFAQVTSACAGGIAVFFALLGACAAWRLRAARVFVVVAGVWLVLSCDVFGLGEAYATTRLLGHYAPFYRAQAPWLFSVAALAAFGLDALRAASERVRRPLAAAFVVVGAVVLVVAFERAHALRGGRLDALDEVHRALIASNLALDERWSAGCFVAALLAGAVCCASRATLVRRVAAGVVVFAAFAQSAGVLARYNPTTQDRFVYPTTAALATVQRQVGDGRVVFLQDNGIPPDANVAHRISTLQSYDAMGVRRYEGLFSRSFRASGGYRDVTRVEPVDLELFGVEWLVGAGDWPLVGTGRSDALSSRAFAYRPLEALGTRTARQTFTCTEPGLRSVSLLLGYVAGSSALADELRVRLEDADTGEVVVDCSFDAQWMRSAGFDVFDYAVAWRPFPLDVGWRLRWAVLDFEPRADSAGRRYALTCTSDSEDGEHASHAWLTANEAPERMHLDVDGEARGDALIFDWRCDGGFVPTADLGPFTLFHFTDGLGPYFSVSRAAHAYAATQVWFALKNRAFDPYRIVILEDDPDAPTPAVQPFEGLPADLASAPRAVRARVLERNATSVRLEVERDEPGWLVACQTYFPGWKATVDGREARVICANHAFSGVEVPAGKSVVELRYEPESFRRGLLAALGAVVVGLAWFALALWVRRVPAQTNLTG
ncbi:MAG: YfhO family protein [Planctomycetes bacterium]|nr:YfhO family protein [Planctomycetota bacterium]